MVYEDYEIIVQTLKDRRHWIIAYLEIDDTLSFLQSAKRSALVIELARVNAEIAKRCWNRIRIAAALGSFRGEQFTYSAPTG